MKDDLFKPYIKPNNDPIYVNRQSNHPPKVLENIPIGINTGISDISSNEEIFNEAAIVYQESLDKSGFKYKMKYNPTPENHENSRKSKNRNEENIVV